jgi:hypothetical protein
MNPQHLDLKREKRFLIVKLRPLGQPQIVSSEQAEMERDCVPDNLKGTHEVVYVVSTKLKVRLHRFRYPVAAPLPLCEGKLPGPWARPKHGYIWNSPNCGDTGGSGAEAQAQRTFHLLRLLAPSGTLMQ